MRQTGRAGGVNQRTRFLAPGWACLLLLGCSSPPPGPYAGAGLQSVTHYPVRVDRLTPRGIGLDDPLGQLDGFVVDSLTDRVEACLAALDEPTEMEREAMHCLPGRLPRALIRSGWNVKVAPDWFTSTCTGQELFPCAVDPILCDAAHLAEKGVVPDPRCPGCFCRAMVQDNETIVTAPNLLVYAGELLRLTTTCNKPWSGPLATCANTYPPF